MKTIHQIGNAALLRVFKPGLIPGLLVPKFGGGLTHLRRSVDFPYESIDIFKIFNRRGESICGYPEQIILTTPMAIWGIELGLIKFKVADGKTIFNTIMKIREFKKRKGLPSHIVKIENKDDDLGLQYVSIYHLSQKQKEILSRVL